MDSVIKQGQGECMELKNGAMLGAAPCTESVALRSDEILITDVQAADDSVVKDQTVKRIRIQDEHGQMYVIAVTDPHGAYHEVTMADSFEAVQGGALYITKDEDELQNRVLNAADMQSNVAGGDQLGSSRVDVSQNWFTSKTDKKVLQSAGHNWKQGQWAKEEVDILQENINIYCRERGVTDPAAVIFEMSKDERKDFYRVIAKGLDRPLFSVYRRVVRMYDTKNHVGKYSSSELGRLRDLRARHGNDWATIGSALGRSAGSVRDRCRLMKEACNSGKWLPEEESRLTAAVYELAGVRQGDEVTQGLSWSAVAEKVASRSEKQCRAKWLNYLNWKHKGGTEWTKEDDALLISKVMGLDVADEADVDWVELAKDWPSVRSPQWLRGKWWNLKRHIAHYQIMPFKELTGSLAAMHGQCSRLLKSNPLRLPLQSAHANVMSVSLPLGMSDGASCAIVGNEEDSETPFHYDVLPTGIATSSASDCTAGSAAGAAYLMPSAAQALHRQHSTGSITFMTANSRNNNLCSSGGSGPSCPRIGSQIVSAMPSIQHSTTPSLDLAMTQSDVMAAVRGMVPGDHSDDEGQDDACGMRVNGSLQNSESDHLQMLEDSSGLSVEDMSDVARDDSLIASANVIVESRSLMHMQSSSDPLLNSSGAPELESAES